MKRAGLPWFRFYTNTIDDLAVSRLSDGLYRIWVGLQCLTSEYGGSLPTPDVIAFRLRKNDRVMGEALKKLIEVGLIEATPDSLRPRNWVELQYKSDSSTNRVRAHRERQRNVSSAVTETAPDTDTESDTETESETDREGDERESRSLTHARAPTAWPDGFKLTQGHIDFAKENFGYTAEEVETMFERFKDHCLMHGKRYADWDAGFRSWIRKQPSHGEIW